MAGTGRIPLWLVALVGGLAVIALLASFFYCLHLFGKHQLVLDKIFY